jgi:MYXO-CTERM domain-containing protein
LNRASLTARRSLLVLCQAALILLCTSSAWAGGRVQWKETAVKERDDKSWRLEVAIYLAHAPDVPHVSMKFEFQPTAYYARDMTDGDKLVEHTVPLTDRQSLIESVDVGFMDSGSGKIEPRTRFTFKVTRAHGYEAGEYKVTIRDTRNDQIVGTSQTLKFQGENETIDRRAMVFSGKDKKKDDAKKDDAKKDDSAKSDGADSGDKPADSDQAKDDAAASGAAKPSEDEAKGPPPIEEKPGGCGCRLAGAGHESGVAGVLLLLGLAGALGQRRRSAQRSGAQA